MRSYDHSCRDRLHEANSTLKNNGRNGDDGSSPVSPEVTPCKFKIGFHNISTLMRKWVNARMRECINALI